MEAALVSAATGALKPVIRKLGTLLGDKYKRFKWVRKNIKSLKLELTAMDAFLEKMSEEEDPDLQDKVWVNEVRELSYDMEDCIDDFMLSVGDKDTMPEGFIDKMKHSLGELGKMKARRRIGDEIHDLKKNITEVSKRNQRYKTCEAFSCTNNAKVDHRALAMFEDVSKLVGIDEPKAEIIELLTEGASTQEQPKLVSIVGSGGMGKTTLAKQVYQVLKDKFECLVFLSVSRNPNTMNILRTILSEVSGRDYAKIKAGSIEQLITKIIDVLSEKRYLVVVDDIWDVETWDVIKCAFPMTSSGSIIITTTRINDVADSCRSFCSGCIYNIRPLDMVHSSHLFHRRLFKSNEECPSDLQMVSDEILKKCAGLPLAIIAISGLLASTERTKHMWNQVKDSIGRALERNRSIETMIKILSLSYFDLPPHLKTCLLYLSIYPEDSVIEKKSLIWRWIAEGFIQKDGRYTAHEIGERCFSELLNRSLIQVAWTNEYGDVESCRIHDIILDFIISKSIEENFVTLVGVPCITSATQSTVRRLSLQGYDEENSIRNTGMVFSHVRSLHVFGHSLEIPSLDEFKHLRVLDFELCHQVINHHVANIGRLFQLRRLNLRWTEVSELPEEIGHLCCLEMLDIRGTKVCELPATIVNLRRLVDLLTDSSVKFPNGIVKMQALEVLEEIDVYRQPLNFRQELGQLQNLRKLVLNFEGVPLSFYGKKEEEEPEEEEYFSFFPFSRRNRAISKLEEEATCRKKKLEEEATCRKKKLEEEATRKKKEMEEEATRKNKKMEEEAEDKGKECNEAIASALQKLSTRNIRSLTTVHGGDFLEQRPLCPVPLSLQEFVMTKFSHVKQVPEWMSSLVNLHLLRLEVTQFRQKDLCVLGSLPALLILEVAGMAKSKDSRFTVSHTAGFPRLRKFSLGRCRLVVFQAGSMPKLEKLDMWFHVDEVQSQIDFDFGIGNLSCLITLKYSTFGWCRSTTLAAAKAAMERAVAIHPNRPTVIFHLTG